MILESLNIFKDILKDQTSIQLFLVVAIICFLNFLLR